MIVPILAMAGSLAAKKIAPPSAGTFPARSGTFVVLLLGTVVLIGAAELPPGSDVGAGG